ncbi:MAG: hypothetical protein Q4C91_13270 [Eubacteriales bacterium]|nr:hypothetical protein [Eubacteriales bacterium]
MKKSSKKRIYWILLGILALLFLAGAAWLIYSRLAGEDQKPANSNAYVDKDASAWDDGIDSEEQTGEITDNILVPGYSGAEMKAGDKTLNLRIGNPEENACYLQATLQLEDGTVLFESGLLEPGTGFEEIELNQTLEAGTYEAWVHYQGYSMDEEPELLNGSDSAFTLTVTP